MDSEFDESGFGLNHHRRGDDAEKYVCVPVSKLCDHIALSIDDPKGWWGMSEAFERACTHVYAMGIQSAARLYLGNSFHFVTPTSLAWKRSDNLPYSLWRYQPLCWPMKKELLALPTDVLESIVYHIDSEC